MFKEITKSAKRYYTGGAVLFLIYFVHLAGVQVLLFNPYDFLSKTSFANQDNDYRKSTDCLLLLTKKQVTEKQTFEPDNLKDALQAPTFYFQSEPLSISAIPNITQRLLVQRTKLRNFYCVFLI